jgi:hypothetical protein
MPLYCCFTAALLQTPLGVLWGSVSAARSASCLLLYSCFTPALLLLYSCFTPFFQLPALQPACFTPALLLLSCFFTAAFLLLSCCFTDALLLLYCYFTAGNTSGFVAELFSCSLCSLPAEKRAKRAFALGRPLHVVLSMLPQVAP